MKIGRGSMLQTEHGFVKFFVTVALIIFLVYAGIQFGKPFYRHGALKDETKEIARISLGHALRTQEQVFERARELKVPITKEDILVTKLERTVRVQTSWSETVEILGLYEKTFDFEIDVEE
jgi:hypothetical protein